MRNEEKRRVVVVVGIPGVGKTTVVARLVEELVRTSHSPELVNFGSVMLEEGLKQFPAVKSRDDMRKLPVEDQRKLQVYAASKISNLRNSFIIVDTHLFIATPEGYWPGMPLDVLRALSPTHLVLVSASAEEILARRDRDATRTRDRSTRDSIEQELETARTMLFASSLICGSPARIIVNSEDKALEAAKEIIESVA